jgi:tubulin polyglutamylase TTLL4
MFYKIDPSFLPRTFCLPADTKLLRRVWEKRGCRAKWIVKPPALARGTGITVINKWSQVDGRHSFFFLFLGGQFF